MAKRKKKSKAVSLLTVAILLVAALAYACGPILRAHKTQKAHAETVVEAQAPVAAPIDVLPQADATSAPSVAAETIPAGLELPRMLVSRTEQVIEHIGYTVSYNADLHLPNWVAYELTAEETDGAEERADHFKPDPLVEGDPVVTKDYSNSGYDRGHMAPAADMKWSAEAMRESFYMTNICPQLHNLNAGDWKTLEEKVRDWAKTFEHVYVACGPIVGEEPKTIGTERIIVVPEAFYKVILSEKDGEWYSIGFVMYNIAGHKPLSTYVKSVDEIEQLAELDFFYNLPDDIEEQIENHYDTSLWGIK